MKLTALVLAMATCSSLLAASPSRPAAPATSSKAPAQILPFIDDDYARAIAVAKERKLPLFVDAWAPW